MALSQRLEMRQSQALVLTPQLLQAIKLLQLSSLDLAAYVEGELERNPLLERGVEDGPVAEQPGSEESDRGEVAETDPADWASAPLETSRTSIEQGMGTELENVFPDDGGEKQAAPEAQPSAYSEW
jgi:RNA polymerase sigma-54 factor